MCNPYNLKVYTHCIKTVHSYNIREGIKKKKRIETKRVNRKRSFFFSSVFIPLHILWEEEEIHEEEEETKL